MTHRLLSFPGSRRFGPRLRRLVLILAAAAPLSGVAVALFLDVRRPDGGLVSADGAGAYRRRPGRQLAFGTGQASEEGLVVVNANGSGSGPVGAPVDLFGWMSGSRLTLTWRRPESPAQVSGFIVEAGSATGLTNIASIVVSGQALTFIPVPAGYYFLRVRAVDAVGTVGLPSREFLLNAGPVPSPPQPPPYLEAIVVGATVTRRGSP